MKRKLIPALAMLLISATMLTSASFAWFTMNSTVKATGMQVQATAEQGIVISDSTAQVYGASATTSTVSAKLYPASTSNLEDWWKSASSGANTSTSNGTYESVTGNTSYYATNEFYIKSSGDALTLTSLDIKSVEVTAGNNAQLISKALRVGINFNTSKNTYIYAPIAGGSTGYTPNKGTVVTPLAHDTASSDTEIKSLGAFTAGNGQKVTVYVWFEGEDENCKSANLQEVMDTLTITVTFGYTAPKAE